MHLCNHLMVIPPDCLRDSFFLQEQKASPAERKSENNTPDVKYVCFVAEKREQVQAVIGIGLGGMLVGVWLCMLDLFEGCPESCESNHIMYITTPLSS